MNRTKYYSPRPEFPSLGFDPVKASHVVGRPEHGIHIPRPEIHPPIDERGFLIKNNARLGHIAIFDLEYDDTSKTHVEVKEGDKVFVTFNKDTKKGCLNIITVEALLCKITPTPDNKDFILYLDASTENKSAVYKIGSRAVLDIGLITEDDEEENAPNIESGDMVEEISPDEILDHFEEGTLCLPAVNVHHHHDHHCAPLKPVWVKKNKCYDAISWLNHKITMEKDANKGYNVLAIQYAKKKPVDVLLIIYDAAGNIIYKALDTSKKVGVYSIFTWTLRDYNTTISQLSPVEKFDYFTTDSAGRFVMTHDIKEEGKAIIEEIEKSNDDLVSVRDIYIDLVIGEDLLSYNPMAMDPKNHHREALCKSIRITADMLKAALYNEPVIDDTTDNGTESEGDNTTPDDSTTGGNETPTDPEEDNTGDNVTEGGDTTVTDPDNTTESGDSTVEDNTTTDPEDNTGDNVTEGETGNEGTESDNTESGEDVTTTTPEEGTTENPTTPDSTTETEGEDTTVTDPDNNTTEGETTEENTTLTETPEEENTETNVNEPTTENENGIPVEDTDNNA